jgi:putative nucleotidyltransferase with HDIG domain
MFEEKESLLFGIMIALTKSIDAKSKWTAGHSERVAKFVENIAIEMQLDEEKIRTLTISAVLHDIGKIAVPEQILDKPAKLTLNEFDIIKTHPVVGAKIISDIPAYENILPGVLYHHEHWDGSGYPEGIKGQQIPLNSRIITVADVFDAITDDRPYRKGMNYNEAILFMKDQKGKLFDAEIVDIFIELSKKLNLSEKIA